MSDDISALLKVHEYFRGTSEEAQRDVLSAARVVYLQSGDCLHEPEDVVRFVYFILHGRLKAVRVSPQGRESLLGIVQRGDQLGMMVGALHEPVPVRVFALEPSTVLELDYEQAMDLTLSHPDLRRLWLKSYAGRLRKDSFGEVRSRGPSMLALLHEDPSSRRTAQDLLKRLSGMGEKLAVFSDSDEVPQLSGLRFRDLVPDGRALSAEDIHRQVEEWQDATRIVFNVQAGLRAEHSARLMEICDRAVYFVRHSAGQAAVRRLQEIGIQARGWRDKVSIAWVLGGDNPLAPVVPGLRDVACRDFKIIETPQPTQARSSANGLERLVHDLRGVRIGLALGGGAARGMSHLGVLKTLEQSGIVVDMIAGTSAGAMTGIIYASGMEPEYAASRFAADLRPSWLFRHLPRGDHLYLLHQYRRGRFDPMLRRYLHDWKLEQLAVPCLSVTVDLVGGDAVVRDQGDATLAILESINLPVLSVPILRGDQALIDGGLVNNIPADVLVSMGCNFVIAVSVTAQMEKRFCNITPGAPTARKRPGTIQTLLRSLQVQNYSLNSYGVGPADVVIAPDVTGFELTEFMRAKELAVIGERAAIEQVPKLRHLLHRLDPQLFPVPETA